MDDTPNIGGAEPRTDEHSHSTEEGQTLLLVSVNAAGTRLERSESGG
jgi:hypothetical protein